MYKCLNEGAPAYLSQKSAQKFKKRAQIHNRTTRNRNDLDLIKCRLATGQRVQFSRSQSMELASKIY